MSEEEFFDRLAAAGLLIRKRVAPSGDLLGYKVALPDDRNGKQEPVFYAGSTLAPDLSLPRIRKRFSDGTPGQGTDAPSVEAPSGPSTARRRTATAVWQTVLVIDDGEDAQVAAHIAAAGEVLDALAKTSAAHTRAELREAAFSFERATRSHIKAERGHDRALRQAARDLVYSGPALGRGEDGATTAMAIDMLFFLVTAAAHWHAKKDHAQQAAAARQAAADIPLAVLYQRGRRPSQPLRQKQAACLRAAVPELAEQILAEPGWPALAATLADTASTGHDPAALLTEAAGRRELGTADSISDVLVWRLRRMADCPPMPPRCPTTLPLRPGAAGVPSHPRRAETTGPARRGDAVHTPVPLCHGRAEGHRCVRAVSEQHATSRGAMGDHGRRLRRVRNRGTGEGSSGSAALLAAESSVSALRPAGQVVRRRGRASRRSAATCRCSRSSSSATSGKPTGAMARPRVAAAR